jgi:isoleucyl-tRNA synthetase
VADKKKINKQLMENTRLVMKVSSMGRAVRSQAGIKVRQPLPKILVKAKSGAQKRGLEGLSSQVLEEVNVKELDIVSDLPVKEWPVINEGDLAVMLDTSITPELAAEGMAREIVHRLQMMRRSAGFDIADHIITYYEGEAYIGVVMESFADYIKQETLSQQLVEGMPEGEITTASYRLGGHNVLLGVKKLG